jgi:hypothetical protein
MDSKKSPQRRREHRETNLLNPFNPFNLRKSAILTIIIISVFSLFSGCMKYSFTGAVPTHLKTVAVPLMANQTAEYGVVERVTDALILRLQRDNTLKIADQSTSDAVLRGTLVRIEDVPYTYSGEAQPSTFSVGEYRLTLVVKIEYYDQTKGEVIWEQEFRNWGTYNHVSGAPEEREPGFDEAINKVTEDVVNQMVSGW